MYLLSNESNNRIRIAVMAVAARTMNFCLCIAEVNSPKSQTVLMHGDISPILLENLQNKQKWHSSIQISKCI